MKGSRSALPFGLALSCASAAPPRGKRAQRATGDVDHDAAREEFGNVR